ncbi:MAG: type II toxin-antitoxin system VapC family toxin [Bacteroidota bacterium]
MNYLLDTHTFIWALTDKSKLSPLVQQTIENADNNIFISSITFWEISLKSSIGKLKLEGILPNALPKLALQTGFQLIELSPDESSNYHNLNLQIHKDPFDRMLIWQAIQRDLILVSKDEHIYQYQSVGLRILW